MPTEKRGQRRRISRPGVAIRVGALRAVREIPGVGGGAAGFQRADTQKSSVSGNLRPKADPVGSSLSVMPAIVEKAA